MYARYTDMQVTMTRKAKNFLLVSDRWGMDGRRAPSALSVFEECWRARRLRREKGKELSFESEKEANFRAKARQSRIFMADLQMAPIWINNEEMKSHISRLGIRRWICVRRGLLRSVSEQSRITCRSTLYGLRINKNFFTFYCQYTQKYSKNGELFMASDFIVLVADEWWQRRAGAYTTLNSPLKNTLFLQNHSNQKICFWNFVTEFRACMQTPSFPGMSHTGRHWSKVELTARNRSLRTWYIRNCKNAAPKMRTH